MLSRVICDVACVLIASTIAHVSIILSIIISIIVILIVIIKMIILAPWQIPRSRATVARSQRGLASSSVIISFVEANVSTS